MYFRIGSREKLTGRVSFGVGARVGELSTERAVTQVRVFVKPVTQQLIEIPVVEVPRAIPVVRESVPPAALPILPSPRNNPGLPPTTVARGTFQAWLWPGSVKVWVWPGSVTPWQWPGSVIP